jgi:hypothetical protein
MQDKSAIRKHVIFIGTCMLARSAQSTHEVTTKNVIGPWRIRNPVYSHANAAING